jgi:AcrR family transcriptional regulator
MARPSKRDELIDAAIRLFNQHGYQATGVDRLMEETGIAKTTLYRHFGSKEDLIVAALAKVDEGARDEMRAYVEAASDDPKERILATFGQLDLWIRDPEFRGCPFMAAAAEFGGGADPVSQQVRLHKRLYLAYFEELVRAAKIPEPKLVARQLVMLHEGAIAFAMVMGPDGVAADARKLAERLTGQSSMPNLASSQTIAR